jgi:hypothetical protein
MWRFVEGADTLDYVATAGHSRVLQVQWRQAGRVHAQCTTRLEVHGLPADARIDFQEDHARFELTVVALDTSATFDAAIWRGRR